MVGNSNHSIPMITKIRSAAIAVCLSAFAASALLGAAKADDHTRYYQVEHPRYGNIGTYAYSIDKSDGEVRTEAQLRVAITVMGFVIYRQDADQVEVFRNDTLVSFQSVTTTNGQQALTYGIAKAGRFQVTTASGVSSAPAHVLPSDPWLLKRVGTGVVVSTKSGLIEDVEVTGGETEIVLLDVGPVSTRHFHVRAGTQINKWEVWLDQYGSPVKFRSLEDGTPINFILSSTTVPTSDLFGLAGGPVRQNE